MFLEFNCWEPRILSWPFLGYAAPFGGGTTRRGDLMGPCGPTPGGKTLDAGIVRCIYINGTHLDEWPILHYRVKRV